MATTDTGSEQYDSDAQGVVVADSDGVRALVTPQAETVVVGQGSVPQEAVREVPEPAPAVEQPPLVAHEPESSFEDMLAAAEAQAVEQPDFEPGDRITGVVEVVSLHGREVFLDIGGKATGYILKSEVSDENGQVTVKQGETIEGIVIGTDFNGVRIGRRLSRQGADFSALKDAFGAGMPVEGKVSGTNKGGYDVLLGGARGFCPFSQIDLYRPADPESFVGQTFEFKITELKGKQVVLSRAALLKAEQAARAADLCKKESEQVFCEDTWTQKSP